MSYSTHIFPYVTDLLMNNRLVNAMREDVLRDVRGEVLEIGFGSGLNATFYGTAVRRLTALDPSTSAWRLGSPRLRGLPFPVLFVEGSAEEDHFPENSFDAVVLTWTLCSVRDSDRVLANVRRVLKPGGRLHFLEHGLSDEPNVQRAQRLWTPAQRILCAGCQLVLPVDLKVEAAGLGLLSLRKGHIARPKALCYVYQGVAEKQT